MSKKKTPAKKPTPAAAAAKRKSAKCKPAPAAKKSPDQIKIGRLLRRIGDLEAEAEGRGETIRQQQATISDLRAKVDHGQKFLDHQRETIQDMQRRLNFQSLQINEGTQALEASRRQVAEWKETIPPKMQELRDEIAEHIDTIAEQNGTIEKQSAMIAELKNIGAEQLQTIKRLEQRINNLQLSPPEREWQGLRGDLYAARAKIIELQEREKQSELDSRVMRGQEIQIEQQRRQIRQLNAAHQSDVKRRAELQRALESCQKQLRETQIKANQLEVNSGLRADYCTVKAQLAAVLEREAAAAEKLQLSDKILADVAECIEFIRQAPIGQVSLMKDYGPLTLAGKIQREFSRRGKFWQEKVNQAAADGMQISQADPIAAAHAADLDKSAVRWLLDSINAIINRGK